MTARLAVDGAVVSFGARRALDAVTLEVAPGEVVAVLGPSGCGKTTLLRAVAGLQPLEAGSVRLDGVDLHGVPPHRRGVGLMFQDHALFPHRDVAGNVGFGLRMQGLAPAAITARVDELLALVDLPGTGGRSIQTLSGGEQQRVALARALAPNPRLLLLDEPLGALDRTLREHLVGELRTLFTDLDLTVVAVTHDQGEAFALADRVLVMDAGQVLREGAPAQVWERPGTRRVAELLGASNLVDVEVLDGAAATPWGVLEVPGRPDGPATLLLRSSRLDLDGVGPLQGTVTASTFQGEHAVLLVAVAGAPPLEVVVPADRAPAVGAAARLSIPAAAVVPLDR